MCKRGYDTARGSFTQFYGSQGLDAALLLIPRVGFLPWRDERVVGTVEAVQRELSEDGFLPLLAGVPGVARVYGPGDVPPGVAAQAGDVFVAPGGDLARFVVVFDGDPLDAPAAAALRALRDRAPALLSRVGLDGAKLQLGGDTAITVDLVDRTMQDLVRVAPVALLGAFLVLALYLRSTRSRSRW